jgi:serine/threonine-protein kinase HipA
MSRASDVLEVWLDCEGLPKCQIGTLAHDRGQVRFRYVAQWLHNPSAFAIDPSLSLGDYPFFPKPELGNFGIFLDSAPDRWGQTLMKRREALQAKDEGRAARTLYAWDYLLGVQDFTRQGALRFRLQGTQVFLGSEAFAAPPVASLQELQAVATALTSKRLDDLDVLRKWLAVLVFEQRLPHLLCAPF